MQRRNSGRLSLALTVGVALTACTPAATTNVVSSAPKPAESAPDVTSPNSNVTTTPIPLQVMGVANASILDSSLSVASAAQVPITFGLFTVSTSTDSIPTGSQKVAYWQALEPMSRPWADVTLKPASNSASTRVTYVQSLAAPQDIALSSTRGAASFTAFQSLPDDRFRLDHRQGGWLQIPFCQGYAATLSVAVSALAGTISLKPPQGTMFPVPGQYDQGPAPNYTLQFRTYGATDSITITGLADIVLPTATFSARISVTDNLGKPVTGLKTSNFACTFSQPGPAYTAVLPTSIASTEGTSGEYRILSTFSGLRAPGLPTSVSITVVNAAATSSFTPGS